VSHASIGPPLAWLSPEMPLTREEPRAASRDPEREKANAAMERYARGEDEAFSELYDVVAPRLRRYLVKASGDAGWADDLVQQTMLQIHRARGRFIAGADVQPWAFAIGRRLLIDGFRRRKHERGTISLETGGHDAGPVQAAAVERGADEQLDGQRLARALEAELARLPENHRKAFELLKNEELSIREAARILGATPTAVKLRAHRAYAALRVALAHLVDRG
jgi:RNA polymerase sigma-70 factor, ECF subfamily